MPLFQGLIKHTKPIRVRTTRVSKDRVLIVTSSSSNGTPGVERQTTAIVFNDKEIKKVRSAQDRLVTSE